MVVGRTEDRPILIRRPHDLVAYSLAVAVAASGCDRRSGIELHIPHGPEARSAIVVFEHSGVASAFAFDLDQPVAMPNRGWTDGQIAISALIYDRSLDDFQIPASELVDQKIGRAFPTPAVALKTEADLGSAVRATWRTVMTLDEGVSSFRIPNLNVDDCLARSRCLLPDPLDLEMKICITCPPDPSPPAPVASPDRAAILPRLVCPSFSRAIQGTDASSTAGCELPQKIATASCSMGQAQFYGDNAVSQLGTSCPSGDFPDGAPADSIFVKPGAVGGTGRSDAPFGTIGQAMMIAAAGSTIALAKGDFDEPVVLKDGVRILGACVEHTRLKNTVVVRGLDAQLANLSIHPPSGQIGLALTSSGAFVRIFEVAICGGGLGINLAQGASTAVDGILIADTSSAAVLLDSGARAIIDRGALDRNAIGVVATNGAMLTTSRIAIARTLGNAITVVSGAEARISRCAIDGTASMPPYATGAIAVLSAMATIEDTWIRDALGVGIHTEGLSIVTASTVAVAGTIYENGVHPGAGLQLANGSRFDGRSIVVDRSHHGVYIGQTKTQVTISDLVVRNADGDFSIKMIQGGHARFDRVWIDGGVSNGVVLEDPSTAVFDDLTIDQIKTSTGNAFGLRLRSPSTATVSHALLRDIDGRAVSVEHAFLRITDLVVLDMRDVDDGARWPACPTDPGPSSKPAAEGISACESRISIERAEFRGESAAILVSGEQTVVHASDVLVSTRDAHRPTEGVVSCSGAAVILRRGMLDQPRKQGISVFGGSLDASDVSVRGAFHGVDANATSSISVARAEFEDCTGYGIHVMHSNTTITDVRVTGTLIDPDPQIGQAGMRIGPSAVAVIDRFLLDTDGHGLDVVGSLNVDPSQVKVRNGRIENNLLGLYAAGSEHLELDNVVFDRNMTDR